MSNIFDKSSQLKEAVKPIVGKIIENNTRPCFRTYKAMVVTPQDATTGYGEVQLMGQGGNAETVKLRLPFAPAVAKLQTGDLAWVAVTYNSWKNAIVWQKIDFSTSGGGSGDFNPSGTYPNLTAGFANSANDPNAVHFTLQSLTDEQQLQARENIGVVGTGKDGTDGAGVVDVKVLENGVVLPNIPIAPEVLEEIKDELFPVDSIIVRRDNISPAQYLVGTWQKIAEGRTLIGADSSHTLGSTGGSETHIHNAGTLTAEITAVNSNYMAWNERTMPFYTTNFWMKAASPYEDYTSNRNTGTVVEGQTGSANSMQPYLVVNCWQRIA